MYEVTPVGLYGSLCNAEDELREAIMYHEAYMESQEFRELPVREQLEIKVRVVNYFADLQVIEMQREYVGQEISN